MDIEGADATLIARLVQRGLVRDVAELYQLTESDLLQLGGLDSNAAQTFLASLDSSKSRDLWRLLFGLDIPRVALAEAQALARRFKDLEEVMGAPLDLLQGTLGHGSEETTRSLVQWSKSSYNRKLIKRLREAGLSFRSLL